MKDMNCLESLTAGLSPLAVLTLANFYHGVASAEYEADIPVAFIIFANAENKTEMIELAHRCPGCVLTEIEEAINVNKWRPIAIDCCGDEEDDFEPISLFFLSEPTDEDKAVIESMFVSE